MLMYTLSGLSYREYFAFNDLYDFEPLALEDILSDNLRWTEMFSSDLDH